MKNKKLDGKHISFIEALYGCADPDMPPMSPEDIKRRREIYEQAKPKLNKSTGKIMIFGTGGDIDKGTPFKDLYK